MGTISLAGSTYSNEEEKPGPPGSGLFFNTLVLLLISAAHKSDAGAFPKSDRFGVPLI